ncbi:uncharacterized protein LOC122257755 isoform X2 [Penaeus japonicus]|uniref:uncharacterized protein LOC122257755 isoform X2 n=1 Tax=Penaeus japonicus TaxID=27405 RepID=UPI001C70B5DE|nr:uncharacterized protein LOC122257755 isoform X2 [Penaeus japonicus]
MVIGVYKNGPSSPAAGTTANKSSILVDVDFHKEDNMAKKDVSGPQQQPKTLLSNCMVNAEESNLQSTNFNYNYSKATSEIVPQNQDLTGNQQNDGEDNESEGELVIDVETKAVSSVNKEMDRPTQNEQTFQHKFRRVSNRTDGHQKMDHAKKWLLSVMVVSSTMSAVSLGSIEDAYKDHCEQSGQEPLSTPVLARLIHGLFQDAEKCRLGPRGNQKIHYRKLMLKIAGKNLPQDSTTEDNHHELEEEKNLKNKNAQNLVDNTNEEPLNLCQRPVVQQNIISEGKQKALKAKDVELLEGKNIQINQSKEREVQEQEVTTSEKCNLNSEQSQMAKDDSKEGCEAAAKRLSQVLKWINNQGRKDVLLKDFAHSASCKEESCSHLCMMFRRVRRHVVAARHACMVLKLYSVLLRLHVSSCNDSQCGLPACPALRATKSTKRTIDGQESSPKRIAARAPGARMQSARPIFEPRSPGGSLPGSPVNSPPSSPDAQDFGQFLPLNSGSVHYMIVPVVMASSSSGIA